MFRAPSRHVYMQQVDRQLLEQFCRCIQDTCPWFPEEGTTDLDIWNRVGKQLRERPEHVPIEMIALWGLVRDSLEAKSEALCLPERQSQCQESLPRNGREGERDYKGPQDKPLPLEYSQELAREEQESDPEREESSEDSLDEDKEESFEDFLDEDGEEEEDESGYPTDTAWVLAAGVKQEPSALREVPLFKTYQPFPCQDIKVEKDIEGFQQFCFPIVECPDPNNNPEQIFREHKPIPLETCKELKTAVSQYGPTAPFTLALLETISKAPLTPHDWQMLTKMSLSEEDYLLWESEFADRCHQQAEQNAIHQVAITAEMLMGKGRFSDLRNQLGDNLQAYQQINICGINAWRALPTAGAKTEDLSDIKQGADEPYQEFICRLLQAIHRLVGNAKAGQILAKHLAFENANPICKSLLQRSKRTGSITDFIRLCAEKGNRNLHKHLCHGQPGLTRECASRAPEKGSTAGGPVRPQVRVPGICPRCRRGRHWVNICRSKFTIDGQPIAEGPKQGQPLPNEKMGVPSPTPPITVNSPFNINGPYKDFSFSLELLNYDSSIKEGAGCGLK